MHQEVAMFVTCRGVTRNFICCNEDELISGREDKIHNTARSGRECAAADWLDVFRGGEGRASRVDGGCKEMCGYISALEGSEIMRQACGTLFHTIMAMSEYGPWTSRGTQVRTLCVSNMSCQGDVFKTGKAFPDYAQLGFSARGRKPCKHRKVLT